MDPSHPHSFASCAKVTATCLMFHLPIRNTLKWVHHAWSPVVSPIWQIKNGEQIKQIINGSNFLFTSGVFKSRNGCTGTATWWSGNGRKVRENQTKGVREAVIEWWRLGRQAVAEWQRSSSRLARRLSLLGWNKVFFSGFYSISWVYRVLFHLFIHSETVR